MYLIWHKKSIYKQSTKRKEFFFKKKKLNTPKRPCFFFLDSRNHEIQLHLIDCLDRCIPLNTIIPQLDCAGTVFFFFFMNPIYCLLYNSRHETSLYNTKTAQKKNKVDRYTIYCHIGHRNRNCSRQLNGNHPDSIGVKLKGTEAEREREIRFYTNFGVQNNGFSQNSSSSNNSKNDSVIPLIDTFMHVAE
jgi:hypothetical protein